MLLSSNVRALCPSLWPTLRVPGPPVSKPPALAGICSKRHRLSGQAAGQVPWRPGGHSRAGCGLSGCGTGRPTQLEHSGNLMVGSLPACVQA